MANPKHYVDNEKFFKEMKKWKQWVLDAREVEDPDPPTTDYIGECFLKIATHLAWRPNFINYTYKEEMISDGIENCLQYIDNFDPEKSKNPFAYFTQIIYYAFIRRIAKEKKQQKIKDRILKRSNISDLITVQEHDDAADYQTQYIEILDKYSFSDDDDDDDKKKK
jgi:hypothetical protein